MNNATLWSEILEALKLQIPKASFDAWLKNTTGQLEDDALTILTDQTYAIDWLENRLRLTIERTAQAIAKRPLTIVFELATTEFEQAELSISGDYRDSYNQIVKPDKVFVGTQYFRHAWLPLLGPALWVIILEMRQRCFWNKSTGEKRNTFEATYSELAAATGLGEKTVRRNLNPEDETQKGYLDLFIPYRTVIRKYSNYQGILVNKNMRWTIRLDDPLTPEDQAKLAHSSKGQNDR